MTHHQHLKQLHAALNFAISHAAELEQEVQDERAAEYERSQDFDPGYVAANWRAHAGNLQSKIDTLKTDYEIRQFNARHLQSKIDDLQQTFYP